VRKLDWHDEDADHWRNVATRIDVYLLDGNWMRFGTGLKVLLLAAVTGGVVAVVGFFLIERLLPGEVTVGPGSPGQIVVEVEGAVATPGLISLPAGSRLNDAIEAAGGLLENADTTSLNLAARVGDGEQITIPSAAGPGNVDPVDPGSSPVGSLPMDAAGLININTAGISELDQLPGIGPTIAQRIIDFRTFYGPFDSVDQLIEVEGISQTMVERFRHMVTTGG
jgi:competence protein ComEA